MSTSTAYRVGRWLGGLPNWAKIALLAIIALAGYRSCSLQDTTVSATPEAKSAPAQGMKTTPEPDAARQLCQSSVDDKKQQYSELIGKKQYWAAANLIRSCAEHLDSPEFKTMVREAEIASHLGDINDPKTAVRDRARAMQMLARDYPDVGAKYEPQAKRLIEQADKSEQEAEKRRKKSEGVSVGMSKDDVLTSSWGKPQQINTTTTSRGNREQWVYGGRNYLYFENGILVAIQN